MTSEMVEHVARAISPEVWDAAAMERMERAGMEQEYAVFMANSLKAARAAIAAKREPTEAMVAAGAVVILRERDEPTSAITISGPTWRAMIDKALEITPPTGFGLAPTRVEGSINDDPTRGGTGSSVQRIVDWLVVTGGDRAEIEKAFANILNRAP